MANFKLINANKEADSHNRKGLSTLYKENKIKKNKIEMLKDESTKESLMAFLFSGKDSEVPNPLAS